MKVLFALRRFAPDGGTGRYATHLARCLVREGHGVHVLCMEAGEGLEVLGRGLVVERVPVPRLGSLVTMPWFAAAVRGRVRAVAADVTLALGRIPGLDIYRAGGGCHRAYLDTVPGWWLSPRHHVELGLDRKAMAQARWTVCNAPDPRRQVVERYGVDPERVVVIPNGVDLERFRPDPEARRQVRAELGLGPGPAVAFLGSGFQRKGLDIAVQALAGMEGATLVVVGKDRARLRFQRLADRVRVPVRFLGGRPDPERILAASDALLLPTRYDSAANAVLEAMAVGLPVVTSRANGAAAFLPDPEAVVDDLGDPAAFGRALARFLLDGGAGARCRAAAERLTWDKSMGAMMGLMERVREERRPS